MDEWLKKHWTTLLGALFILAAVTYLFKYSVSQGWVTNNIRIGIGLIAGAGFALAGMRAIGSGQRRLAVMPRPVAEIAAGLGFAVLYTTFSFAGIYFAIWTPMTVLLCMTAVTALLCVFAYKQHLRMLMIIGLIGALAAPLVMRSESDQVFTLFLYLLVINTAYFGLSIQKSWTELRVLSFCGSWLLYTVYYFHFEPVVTGVWSLPFRYALAAFVFYVAALMISSWRDGMRFEGVNLYLGVLNGVLFGLWSVTLLDGLVSFAYPLALMGLLYAGMAYLVYRLTGAVSLPVVTKLLGGLFLLLIAASQIGSGLTIKPLISVYVWLAVAVLLLAAGRIKRASGLQAAAVLVWLCVGCYWFAVTWDTPRGEWFGVYMPFLNWGALSWELLALLGFYFSLRVRLETLSVRANDALSNLYAVLSHLVVGGLLMVQIQDVIREYRLESILDMELSLSAAWGIYALLLFLWGAYSRQSLFRIFGSTVLVLVAIKTLFFDLAGTETLYRVLVLFGLGIVSFAISIVNNKWLNNERPQRERPDGSEAAADAGEHPPEE